MKTLFLALLFAVLAGCASAPPHIDHSYTAQGQAPRVKFIVLHYTAIDLPTSLKTLTTQEVSAHYMLTDEPHPKFFPAIRIEAPWNSGAFSSKAGSGVLPSD